jgi:hypothetical protein
MTTTATDGVLASALTERYRGAPDRDAWASYFLGALGSAADRLQEPLVDHAIITAIHIADDCMRRETAVSA